MLHNYSWFSPWTSAGWRRRWTAWQPLPWWEPVRIHWWLTWVPIPCLRIYFLDLFQYRVFSWILILIFSAFDSTRWCHMEVQHGGRPFCRAMAELKTAAFRLEIFTPYPIVLNTLLFAIAFSFWSTVKAKKKLFHLPLIFIQHFSIDIRLTLKLRIYQKALMIIEH